MTDAPLLAGLRIQLERTKDVPCGVCGQTPGAHRVDDRRVISGIVHVLRNQGGPITVRVLKQPSQGTLEIARDRGFTNYAADNFRAKCNAQEVELTRVWYKSNADFKGRDQAQLEAFFSTGTSIKTTLQITVK